MCFNGDLVAVSAMLREEHLVLPEAELKDTNS